MREPYIYYSGKYSGQSEYQSDISRVTADIDTLTFNRITDYSALTAFQKRILTEVFDRLIDFRRENADLLESVVKSYSINSVSLSFNDLSVRQINGVYIPADVYSLLGQTGLTCRVI